MKYFILPNCCKFITQNESCLAPENVLNDKVGTAADVWKVGVLSFIL